MPLNFIRSRFRQLLTSPRVPVPHPAHRPTHPPRFQLESLEGRDCPSTFSTVYNGHTETFTNLPAFNNAQQVNLGDGGTDVLLTDRVSINGVPANGHLVTLINPRQNSARAYDVGPWWETRTIHPVEGQTYTDVVFDSPAGIFSVSNLSVLTASGVQTYPHLPAFNGVQQVDSGGNGENLVLTYQFSVNGIAANGHIVTVVNPRQASTHSYDVGPWSTSITIAPTTGQAATDVVFYYPAGIFSGNGNLSVLTSTGVESFSNLPAFNNVQTVNLGDGGTDLLLTYNFAVNGIPANGHTITVVNPRQGVPRSYNVGPWQYSLSINPVAGQSYSDIVFFAPTGLFSTGNLSILTAGGIQTYSNLKPFNSIQKVDSGGNGTNLLLTDTIYVNGIAINNQTVTVVNPRQTSAQAYFVGPWTYNYVTPATGRPGNDVVFVYVPLVGHTTKKVLTATGVMS